MSGLNSYALGKSGEALAAEFLKDKGFFISAKNYRYSIGEIDIIAENKYLVLFVEVKLRKESAGYSPKEAVTIDKKRRILMAAKNYIYRSHTKLQPRFDVIEIVQKNDADLKNAEVNWIQNAFGVSNNGFF